MMPQTYKAGGNVPPCRFVKFSADKTVVVAGSGDRVCGISQRGTRRVPGESDSPFTGLDDGYAAISGENVLVYGDGCKEVALELGGTVTYGQRVGPTSTTGTGVALTTDKDQFGAVAQVGGVSGEIIYVDVVIGEVSV